MRVSYGPPANVGVRSLQYVSGSEDGTDYTSAGLHLVARPVGLAALGVWVFSALSGRRRLGRQALAVSAGAFLVEVLAKPR